MQYSNDAVCQIHQLFLRKGSSAEFCEFVQLGERDLLCSRLDRERVRKLLIWIGIYVAVVQKLEVLRYELNHVFSELASIRWVFNASFFLGSTISCFNESNEVKFRLSK